MQEHEVEVIEDNDIDKAKDSSSNDIIIVNELLKKNNELAEYHNNILTENRKTTNINMVVNICSKFILLPIAIYILFKISIAIEVNNERETQIINQMPKLDIPKFTINTPTPNVTVDNQTILNKVVYYKDYAGEYFYKNTSNSTIYCQTDGYYKKYDVVFSPKENISLNSALHVCKDSNIIKIENKKDFNKIK